MVLWRVSCALHLIEQFTVGRSHDLQYLKVHEMAQVYVTWHKHAGQNISISKKILNEVLNVWRNFSFDQSETKFPDTSAVLLPF